MRKAHSEKREAHTRKLRLQREEPHGACRRMGQPRSPLPAGSGAGGSGGPAAQAQQRTAASSHLERTTTMGQSEEQSLRLLSLNCPVQRGGSHLANPPGQPGLGLRPTTT